MKKNTSKIVGIIIGLLISFTVFSNPLIAQKNVPNNIGKYQVSLTSMKDVKDTLSGIQSNWIYGVIIDTETGRVYKAFRYRESNFGIAGAIENRQY